MDILHHSCNMDAYHFQEWSELLDINVVDVTSGSSLRGPYTSYDGRYGITYKIRSSQKIP